MIFKLTQRNGRLSIGDAVFPTTMKGTISGLARTFMYVAGDKDLDHNALQLIDEIETKAPTLVCVRILDQLQSRTR